MPTPQRHYTKTYRKKYPEKRKTERKKNYATTGGPKLNPNHRMEWTLQEIEVLELWPYTDRELHKFIGRSVQAIQLMRHKLKKEVKCITQIIE